MTLVTIITLFATMLVLALVPGVSVFTVTTRSAALGFKHGAVTASGVVAGDVVYIVLAISGLSLAAELMGKHLDLIGYIAGMYLIWLGVGQWKSGRAARNNTEDVESSLLASFLTGLLVTLGDQKAILFYLGFFPAFIDLTTVTLMDAVTVIATAVLAVGGAKLAYAFMADRAGVLSTDPGVSKAINRLAGAVLIGVGVYFILAA